MTAGSAAPDPAANTTKLESPEGDHLRTGQRVAVVLLLAAVLVTYVVHAALPATPFPLPGPSQLSVSTILPEGWAFFTKSPRSESLMVFQRTPDGDWEDITNLAQPGPRGLMGLNRRDRSQGTELALLLAGLDQEDWQACEREPTACLSTLTDSDHLVNRSTHHSVCGEVGFVLWEVLPWAWRDAPTVMPSKVVRGHVTC